MALDWSNERYVRLYTRDTTTWKLLTWQARTVLLHMLRKVDRAGVLDVGDDGVDGLAAMLELPLEVVEPGIAALTDRRRSVVVSNGGAYVLPNFLAAQEARASDAQRQRDLRERRRAEAMQVVPEGSICIESEWFRVDSSGVTSHAVTRGHTSSHDVTPSLAKPSLANPIQEREESESALSAPPPPELKLIPKAGKTPRPKKPQRLAQSPVLQDAERLWSLQECARRRVSPNCHGLLPTPDRLRRIVFLLENGRTFAELEMVVGAFEREALSKGSLKFFDGETNWRAGNVDRQLGWIGDQDPTPAEKSVAVGLLSRLAERTRVRWDGDSNALRVVVARMRSGVSVEDLWTVARYCASPRATGGLGWAEQDTMRAFLTPSTLFGAASVEKHLTAAKAWAVKLNGQPTEGKGA